MLLRPRLLRCLHAGLLACLLAVPAAAVPADAAAERERIETERRLIEAAFADEEAACLRRFVVTPCIEAVQARRREALAPLRHQELLLDEAERRARAAARLQGIEARRAAVAARPPAASAVMPAQLSPDPQNGTAAAAPSAVASQPARAAPSQDRSAAAEAAARRAAAAQRRRDDAAADRARIAERRAQQQGQRSAPLPVPAARSAESAAAAASAAPAAPAAR
jgi:hypothetical protein